MLSPILGVDTDSHDVLIFKSIEDAASYMEPEDAGIWEAYTSDGRVVRVSVEGCTQGLFANRGCIKLEVTDEFALEKLQNALTRFLSVHGRKPSNDTDLAAMVQQLVELTGRCT